MLRRNTITLVLATMMMLHLCGAAWAVDDYTEFDLTELMEMDVVYGASAYEQSMRSAPSSVTVITAEEIDEYGHRTLDDILSTVPGFFVTSDRTYSYAGVRGLSRPGDYNSRLLVLVDGHRLNDNLYSTGAIGTEFPVDVGLIKRIEVIRGPSSSLYGSGAFFGVLNVVTKGAPDLDGGEVAAATASYDSKTARLSYGREIHGGAGFLVSGTFFDSEGRDLYYPEFDDPSSNGGVFEHGDSDRTRQLFGRARWGAWKLNVVHSDREKGNPTASWDTQFNDSRTKGTDRRTWVDLEWTKQFEGHGGLVLRAAYDDYGFDGSYAYDQADYEADPGAEPFLVLNQDDALGRWITTDLRWTEEPGDRTRMIVGAQMRRNIERHQANYDTGDEYLLYFESDVPSTEIAAYVQQELIFTEQLQLSLGLRHDRYDRFDSTNPRLGLFVYPRASTALKVLFGTAFRAPNAYELYYGDNTNWQLWNPDLQPERIQTFEFVAEQELTRRIRCSASYFHYDIEDLISQTVTEDDLLIFRNRESVRSDGLEISIDGRMLAGVKGRLGYSYQKTIDRESLERLSNSPAHLVTASLLSPLLTSTTLGCELQYMSERKTVLGDTAASHTLVHATLRHQFLPTGLTLSASAFNVFDANFGDPGSLEHTQQLIPRDGRSIRVTAEYAW